jgi:hypothetical protein
MINIIFAIGFLLIPACLAAHLNRDIRRNAGQARALVGVSCSLPGLVLDCNLNANEKLPMQSVYLDRPGNSRFPFPAAQYSAELQVLCQSGTSVCHRFALSPICLS